MNAETAEGISRSKRTYWRRKADADPWWPWGILPLIGLLLLFVIGVLQTAPAIQAQTQDTVAQHLQRQGVDIRNIEVDGRRIRIEAVAGQFDEAQIRAMAKGTECETWAGELVCPSDVEVKLHREAVAPVAVAAPEPAPVSEPRFHDFRFTRDNGGVTLEGEIPDEQTRAALVAQAGARFDRVVDRLTVSGDTATTQHAAAAAQALDILALAQTGAASWTGGVFSATGEASPDQEAALNAFLARGSDLTTGELSFATVRSASSCNEQFSTLLSRSSINFRTGSAEIQDSSAGLLTSLAELARQCPGNLTIAGHTDDTGDANMNQALSESRAAAVRDALSELGVVSQRLSARGYGETQPIADNRTAEGRAKNRRISIQLSESN